MILTEQKLTKNDVRYLMCIEYTSEASTDLKLEYQTQLCESNHLTYIGNGMFGTISPVFAVVELVSLKEKFPDLLTYILDMCLMRVTDVDDLMQVIKND